MTHNNRSQRGLSRNPNPGEILAARTKAGLTQTEAGKVLHTTVRVWQQWESGERRMHSAFWQLFKIKTTRQLPPIDN